MFFIKFNSSEPDAKSTTHVTVPQIFVGVLLSVEPTDHLRHIQVFLCFGPSPHLIKTKYSHTFVLKQRQIFNSAISAAMLQNVTTCKRGWSERGPWKLRGETLNYKIAQNGCYG